MSTDVTMLYEALYRLASKGSEDALFGTSAQLAQGAFQRASAGMPMPTIWFEVPLSGAPRFDLHVAHSNDDLHERAPMAPTSWGSSSHPKCVPCSLARAITFL